jgi:hypothetical protein
MSHILKDLCQSLIHHGEQVQYQLAQLKSDVQQDAIPTELEWQQRSSCIRQLFYAWQQEIQVQLEHDQIESRFNPFLSSLKRKWIDAPEQPLSPKVNAMSKVPNLQSKFPWNLN